MAAKYKLKSAVDQMKIEGKIESAGAKLRNAMEQIKIESAKQNTSLVPWKKKSFSDELVSRSSVSWYVKLPRIKRHSFHGHMVPNIRRVFYTQKRRRITIEVRGPALRVPKSQYQEMLYDKDIVVLRIFRPPKKKSSATDSSIDQGYSTDVSEVSYQSTDASKIPWVQCAQYKLEEVKIRKVLGKVCEVELGSGNDMVRRDIRFEDEKETHNFMEALEKMEKLQLERAKRQTSLYQGSLHVKSSLKGDRNNINYDTLSSIDILVEIVGASNLPVHDVLLSTDPYVIVRMGGKEIHRTEVIPNNTDPIWTLENGSLFLLRMPPEEFFSCSGGMSFTLKDYDALRANPVIGQVTVPLNELLQGKGDRVGYDLDMSWKAKKQKRAGGTLFLRFKTASEYDIEFMQLRASKEKRAEIYLSETYLPPRIPQSKILRGQRKRGPNGEMLYRTKPFPDPDREEETKWMTEQEIETESMKPSTHWVEAGSGKLAKVYFEVIGCNDLPNMDAATMNIYDKTDCFACIAFEDCVVNTDVISDSLSPRWMPWCYRAFVLNVDHPSSDILVGVFDYDPELSPAQLLSRATDDLHDLIARVKINIAKFCPNTTYNLTYPLFLGADLEKPHKKQRGRIHLRLRIEVKNPRKTTIAGLKPAKQNYLSVARKPEFEVLHSTVGGKKSGEDKFSLQRLTELIEELREYERCQESMLRAFLVVLLWRGHYKVKIWFLKFNLPIHSMVAFFWGTRVTKDFNLLPSFLLFCVAWVMLACNEQWRRHPSPWRKAPSYFTMLRRLLFNSAAPEFVPMNDHLEETLAYNEKLVEADERWLQKKKEKKKERKAMRQIMREELKKVREDIDIATAKASLLNGGMNVNPLNSKLFPLQKRLEKFVLDMRIARSIVLWEEVYFAFWVVTLAFAGSALAVFVPWGFLLRWFLRIGAWVLLGPWMALVDRYFLKIDLDDIDLWENFKTRKFRRITRRQMKKRIAKEHAMKLKAMMRFCFGKFLVSMPRFKQEMHFDYPLPESSATPYDPQEGESVQVVVKKFGQHLSGNMVMKREVQVMAEETMAARSHKKKKKSSKKAKRRSREVPKVVSGEESEVDSFLSEPAAAPLLIRRRRMKERLEESESSFRSVQSFQ